MNFRKETYIFPLRIHIKCDNEHAYKVHAADALEKRLDKYLKTFQTVGKSLWHCRYRLAIFPK